MGIETKGQWSDVAAPSVSVWGGVSSHKETAGQWRKALESALFAVQFICSINLHLENGYMHSWINRWREERCLLVQACKTLCYEPPDNEVFSLYQIHHLWGWKCPSWGAHQELQRLLFSQTLRQSPKQTSCLRQDEIGILKAVVIQAQGTHGNIKTSSITCRRWLHISAYVLALR